ncbi:hypothetical protein EDB85DRAFT_1900334 [Lactarius pseudohatsudake]|nr:hypothetical protein EDB85DRAFT_1900334 [Lactarius pseudohatsudake]
MGQYKFIGRMCTSAPWANMGCWKNTCMSTVGQYKCIGRMYHGPIQALRQGASVHHGPIQAMWQSTGRSTEGQYKLVSKMDTLAPWANTSILAEHMQEHRGPIQAHWQGDTSRWQGGMSQERVTTESQSQYESRVSPKQRCRKIMTKVSANTLQLMSNNLGMVDRIT